VAEGGAGERGAIEAAVGGEEGAAVAVDQRGDDRRLGQRGARLGVGVEHERPRIGEHLGDAALAARDAAEQADHDGPRGGGGGSRRLGSFGSAPPLVHACPPRLTPPKGRCVIPRFPGGRPILRRDNDLRTAGGSGGVAVEGARSRGDRVVGVACPALET
jgi:hypothetical protein